MNFQPREGMNFKEKAYLIEIVKGLAITIRHAVRNLFHQKNILTVEYPEQKKPVSPRFRGQHRLMRRVDGSPRCVACMMCSTACPASCITIVAGSHEDPTIEKYPIVYEIDELRCIFCGMCVEACPCDAIRMDTGIYDMADYTRESLVFRKDMLVQS